MNTPLSSVTASLNSEAGNKERGQPVNSTRSTRRGAYVSILPAAALWGILCVPGGVAVLG